MLPHTHGIEGAAIIAPRRVLSSVAASTISEASYSPASPATLRGRCSGRR